MGEAGSLVNGTPIVVDGMCFAVLKGGETRRDADDWGVELPKAGAGSC